MKSGIKLLSETPGSGPVVGPKDRILVVHSCYLSKGDVVYENRKEKLDLTDRESIAGFRYGLEGMRVGGQRKFKASPHLCYGEDGVPGKVPSNAALVFEVKLKSIM